MGEIICTVGILIVVGFLWISLSKEVVTCIQDI